MATLLQWKLCWGFRYGCLSLLAKDPDYGARRLRLGAAVEAGELTLEQSRIMFDDLRKDVAETNEQVFVEAFRERLGTAIDAGKMTPEEALCGPNITPGEAKGNGNRRRLRRLAITGVAYKRLLNLNLELGRISAFYEESQYHSKQ